jgi:peptidoglycan biosynthesis protein MviN/MurJ (putative lipid II flippase)
MGFLGLALGTSIAAIANGAVLVWLLRGRLDRRIVTVVLGKVIVAAAMMALSALGIDRVMSTLAPGPGLTVQIVRLGASIGGAIAVLTLAARLLQIREFDEGIDSLRARVRKLLGR